MSDPHEEQARDRLLIRKSASERAQSRTWRVSWGRACPLTETNRHAGHADILREQLDSAAEIAAENSNLPEQDATWWENYRARVERTARAA